MIKYLLLFCLFYKHHVAVKGFRSADGDVELAVSTASRLIPCHYEYQCTCQTSSLRK